MEQKWWQKEIIYQIYPKSFRDSNGDGIGDLPGIVQKLPYLKDLGVTMLWLCPIYQSPMDDNGYDVSDYQALAPEFGTMEDLELLIQEAGKLGIRILLDLVINHTSDEHAWFQQALTDPQSPYHDYYIFKSGKQPPTTGGPSLGAVCGKRCPAGMSITSTLSEKNSPTSTGKTPPCAKSCTTWSTGGWTRALPASG